MEYLYPDYCTDVDEILSYMVYNEYKYTLKERKIWEYERNRTSKRIRKNERNRNAKRT